MTPGERADEIVDALRLDRGASFIPGTIPDRFTLRVAIREAIEAAVEAERQRCAKTVEDAVAGWREVLADADGTEVAPSILAAIRKPL